MSAYRDDAATDLKRQVAELEQRLQTGLAERDDLLLQRAATAEILKVINGSPGDLAPVFDVILEKATLLCAAGFSALAIYKGEDMHQVVALRGAPPALAGMLQGSIHLGPETGLGRLVRGERFVHIVDAADDEGYRLGNPVRRALVDIAGARSYLAVPIHRDGVMLGSFTIYRREVRPFSAELIALLQSFADQAAIAIENARLFNETQETLQQQTAISDILSVMSNSPGDVRPVLASVAGHAARICEAPFVDVLIAEDGVLRNAAVFGELGEQSRGAAYVLDRNTVMGRSVCDRETIQVVDLQTAGDEFPTGRDLAIKFGHHTTLCVPLIREGNALGTILIRRTEVRPFDDKHLTLLKTFADQAAIAIENVRLFNELRQRTEDLSESLQQQTATADVLKVISDSPGKIEPVFDKILGSARQLCEAKFGHLLLFDGETWRAKALHNVPEAYATFWNAAPVVARPETNLGRVQLSGKPDQVADVRLASGYLARSPLGVATVELGGARTLLTVPLLKESKVIGGIALYRTEVRPFNAKQIELLSRFADQAVIAIENARLFDELRQRTDDLSESLQQQTATADVLKVISRSAFDLQTVLDTLVVSASKLCDADRACIFQKQGEVYRWVSNFGFSAELIAYADEHPFSPGTQSTTSRVALEGVPIHNPDVLADPNYKASEYQRLGNYRTMLGIPLLREGVPIGVFILTREQVRPFSDRQIELVTSFADQAVIAIENVRLFDEVQARTRELAASLDDLRAAQDRLVQTEKLASLGQLTAGIAHEIKNPLNFVNNFSALSAELTDELNDLLKSAGLTEKMRAEVDELTGLLKDNLVKVVQHGKRADSIVKNMLLHSREGAGEHRPADINALLDESLNLAYHGARAEKSGFNITLQRDFDASAGAVELFPQEITRAFLNLISNGFYAASKRQTESGDADFEPTLRASTKDLGHTVEIRIRDNGIGIPPEVKEKMFNPFFTTKPAGEGTGLGLSMSHDIIVKQHGGRIDVLTEPGQFTEFTIVLPRTSHLSKNP